MNRRITSVALVCALAAAASLDGAVKPRTSTPEEKAARAARRLRALNETGGFIADPRGARGTYVFVDYGVGIDTNVLAAAARACQNSCMILTKVVSDATARPFSFAAAKAAFAAHGGLMATFLVDEDAWPLEVVCPEQRWAAVNVRALRADAPARDVLEARVRKMMSRSIGQVFQAGYAFSSVSTMNLIGSARDLDRIATEGLATECTTVVQATAEKFGYRAMRRVLYRKAVEEGWAPPPANAFQRSAWERVRSEKERGPTNPIEIPMPKAK